MCEVCVLIPPSNIAEKQQTTFPYLCSCVPSFLFYLLRWSLGPLYNTAACSSLLFIVGIPPASFPKEFLNFFQNNLKAYCCALRASKTQETFTHEQLSSFHIIWKLLKMSHLNFWILAFSTNFCPIKTDLSGNTVWPQASDFQKLAKMDHFWHF